MVNVFNAKGLGILLFLFLVTQTTFFYFTTKSIQTDSNHLTTQPCAPVESMEECNTLDQRQCEFRLDCFPVMAQQCGNNADKAQFVDCLPNHGAQYGSKMDLVPPLPKWGHGHSDRNYLCAYHEGVSQRVFRFENIVPPGWTQVKCALCEVHPPDLVTSQKKKSGLSLVALVYKEFDSFSNALHSWKSSGLLDYADETILWINARSPDQDPIEELAKKFGLTIMSSEVNLGIGPAISNLILATKNPLVIFLEKDWEVIGTPEEVIKELNYAKRLILSDVPGSRADAVKLRSRWNAGYPNIDKKLCIPPEYDNVELNDYAQFRWFPELNDHQWWLPHLFCNIFHFERDKDLLATYPNRIWKCGHALCFDSAQCGWTNNPILFKKHWYLDTLYKISMNEDNPSFEGGTYYSKEWVEPHFVIAQPEGFFRHHEINEHM